MKITMRKKGDLRLNEGFEKFLQKCKAPNLSGRTISYYEKEFDRLTGFIHEGTLLNEITPEMIEDYVIFLQTETGVNDVTIIDLNNSVIFKK